MPFFNPFSVDAHVLAVVFADLAQDLTSMLHLHNGR
jgi:hypothetical protein